MKKVFKELSNMACVHSNACRTFYNFQKKETTYENQMTNSKNFFENNEEEILEEKMKAKKNQMNYLMSK